MTAEELQHLKPGDIVRHKSSGGLAYIVTGNYGGRVTAVRTADITNAAEWEMLETEAPKDRPDPAQWTAQWPLESLYRDEFDL